MNRNGLLALLALVFWVVVSLISSAQAGWAAAAETLRYSINWPSGLSLGEAVMLTKALPDERVEMEFHIDAGIPGFRVLDHYMSLATSQLCSLEFHKRFEHGARKADERSTFDHDSHRVKRETVRGGSSEMETGPCPRDALTFLQYLRRELAAGRIPPQQTVYFGAPYEVRVQYRATEKIVVGDERVETDALDISLKGKASEHRIQMNFARDEARTLVRVKVPFTMGLFSMELVP
jgi:hypothetical protein